MRVFDAQLHEPAVSFEWEGADDQTRSDVLLELQLGFMRAIGVEAAILFPSRYEWGVYAASRIPDRFSLVTMVGGMKYGGIDPATPALRDLIEHRMRSEHVLGVRVVLVDSTESYGLDDFQPTFDACTALGLPLFVVATRELPKVAELAARNPGLPAIIVDQAGMMQPPPAKNLDAPPFRLLPELLALAEFPNVAIKLSGMPALSLKGYPYRDIWPSLHQIVEAFGPRRIMWGSDISRFYGRVGFHRRPAGTDEPGYVPSHNYAESLFYLRETDQLSDESKQLILGGSLQRIMGWPR